MEKTKEKVIIVKCPDYKKTTVKNAIKKIIDFSKIDFPSGLLLKPNMLSARGPEESVTTHPVIVEVLSELLPKPVYIGDSPPGNHKFIEHYWESCGYKEIADKTKATLVKIEGRSTVFNLNVAGRNISFPLSDFALKRQIFNLPKFKTHNITVLTLCMKNLYGLIPGYPKGLLHAQFPEPEYFNRFIIELYRLIENKIVFNLVDAVEIMDKNGPSSGRKRHYGYLIAGKNAVCVDTFCASIAGLSLQQVPSLKIYREICGIPDFEIVGDEPELINDFGLPSSSPVFRIQDKPILSNILRFTANQLTVIPVINYRYCKKCMECFKICPAKAISEDLKINRKKCINCLCCFEVCPHRAISVRKSFLAKIILP